MEPLLRPIRPVFLMADFCLKLFHSVFGPTKLCGQFATRLDGLLVTCLGITCRLSDHIQNQMARLFERIVRVRPGNRFRSKRDDCFCCA